MRAKLNFLTQWRLNVIYVIREDLTLPDVIHDDMIRAMEFIDQGNLVTVTSELDVHSLCS